jgi:hypothetical protein
MRELLRWLVSGGELRTFGVAISKAGQIVQELGVGFSSQVPIREGVELRVYRNVREGERPS